MIALFFLLKYGSQQPSKDRQFHHLLTILPPFIKNTNIFHWIYFAFTSIY